MAWLPTFLDCFGYYFDGFATTYGAWDAAIVPDVHTDGTGSDLCKAEDGMLGLAGGYLTKNLAAPCKGAIINTRGSGTGGSGLTCVMKIADGSGGNALVVGYDAAAARITFTDPNGGTHLSTQISTPNNQLINYDLAFLFNGSVCNYELYINGVKLTDIGSSVTTAALPDMTSLRTFSSGVIGGLSQRSHIGVKQYSGSGPSWQPSDLYGNVLRALQYPNNDGRWPSTTAGRHWVKNFGSGYYQALSEQYADPTTNAATTVNPAGVPDTSAAFLDRASWTMAPSPAGLTTCGHLQVTDLVSMANGTGQYLNHLKYATGGAPDFTVPTGIRTAASSPTFMRTTYALDPRDGGTPWTKAKIDNIEWAIEAYVVST